MGEPWRGGGLVGLPRTCGDLATAEYEWYYNWSPAPSCPNAGVPFVPMVKSGFQTLPSGLMGSSHQCLLTFNEPDNAGMTVARALGLWPQLESTGRRLSSPAVTETARGSKWLAEFMLGAKTLGFRVDFIAAHWYGGTSLKSYLDGIHAKWGLPVWLTEFCVYNGSLEANTRFAERIGPMLAALPYLQRVGWFCNRSIGGGYEHSGLVGSSGALTSVGTAYKAWQK